MTTIDPNSSEKLTCVVGTVGIYLWEYDIDKIIQWYLTAVRLDLQKFKIQDITFSLVQTQVRSP